MISCKKFLMPTILCVLIVLSSADAYSQSKQTDNQGQVDNIDTRIHKQTIKINRALKQGSLEAKQAKKLKANLNNIANEAAAMRKQSGTISDSEYTKLDSELKQNFNNINTHMASNQRTSEDGQVLGPNWVAGKDGAQDPRKLRQQMKAQEKRQLQQYDQAMQQTQELHQQEYEKQMLEKLGKQRPEILQNKQDVQQIRKDTGAN